MGLSGTEGWPELEQEPIEFKHAACPIVRALDAAHTTVVDTHDRGLISEDVARQRLGVIELRRLALAAAQREFGCPRDAMASDAERDQAEKSHDCELPVATVSMLAFGADETMAHLLNRGSNVNTGSYQ